MERRMIITAIVIAAMIVAGVTLAVILSGSGHPSTDGSAAQAVVTEFGSRLKNISLTAPASAVVQSLDENFSSLVAPDLLAQWESDPTTAPGRLTSSPWPDSIGIRSVVPTGPQTYSVSGEVIEMTSAGQAGSYPIELTVQNVGGAWLIVGLTENRPQ